MRQRFSRIRSINKSNLSKLSASPGVYGIYTKGGKLLKVGRAKQNRPAERIEENASAIAKAKKFSFIPTPTKLDAIALETRLIKQRNPPLNIEKKGK